MTLPFASLILLFLIVLSGSFNVDVIALFYNIGPVNNQCDPVHKTSHLVPLGHVIISQPEDWQEDLTLQE